MSTQFAAAPDTGVATTPNILTIAGSDPSGGAGIQADLKSISAGGGYGMAAITALTAQNTQGVTDVHIPPAEFLAAQLDAVSSDVHIDAVKIGMLANAQVIEVVSDWLRRVKPPIVVLDPVMIATSGDALLDESAVRALERLIPLADLITPNVPELAVIAGESAVSDWESLLAQAARVAATHGVRVLAKSGHLAGTDAPDALVSCEGSPVVFAGERIATENTHGTGCSLSAAVATRAARLDGDFERAVAESKAWLSESLRTADELTVGEGHGPVNHFAGLWARGGLETRPTPESIREDWWERIAPVRQQTDELGFIQQLTQGTLKREDFLHYIAQDVIYLRAYARVLARVAELAPTVDEQAFWAKASQGAIIGEILLHRDRLGSEAANAAAAGLIESSAATDGYVNHLLAAGTRGYAEGIAAVLPCYWVYSDLGIRITRGDFGDFSQDPSHPYAEWIASYDDERFAADTETAIGYVTRAAADADAATRGRMWRAFEAAAIWEREFFGQTAAG